MRVGNFSLLVPEGRERDSGHVSLDHGRQYTLRMGNHSHVRCDAEVVVDGKDVGLFRINAGGVLALERPAHDQGRFTFFVADSQEAKNVGVASIAVESRGLIQVRFKPEKKQTVHDAARRGFYGEEREEKTSGGMLRSLGAGASFSAAAPRSQSAGVTGLTGKSNQDFVTVSNLDYDPAGETMISLRLVADQFSPRELTPATRANPVPSAVE